MAKSRTELLVDRLRDLQASTPDDADSRGLGCFSVGIS